MAAKRKRRRAPAKGRPKGKTVHVRNYCRGFARRFRGGSGKSHRGEDMPF